MESVRAIKKLESQIANLQAEIDAENEAIKGKQRSLNAKRHTVKNMKAKIEKLKRTKPSEIRVSEHAILRYLERVVGMDIEIIKQKILTESVKNGINFINGKGEYPCDGFSVLVKDYTITTILVK